MKRFLVYAIASIFVILVATTVIDAQNPIKRQKKSNNMTEQTSTKGTKQSKNKSSRKQSNAQSNTINVYSEEQFLEALGNNRTIILQKSLNLSKVLDHNLILSGYNNLTIKGKSSSISLIVATTTVTILSFETCNKISICDLVLGHEAFHGCEEGVIAFYDCSGVTISNCDIYGCGWYGVRFENTKNVVCSNSIIHDCEYDMVEIYNSSNVKFNKTKFKESWSGTMTRVYKSKNIQFVDCTFVDETDSGQSYYREGCFDLKSNISLNNCTIRSSSPYGYGNTKLINQSGCKWQ